MSWKVVYSSQARQDLRDIFEYISKELFASEAAKNQAQRIMQSVRNLEDMPLRHRLYEDSMWQDKGLRFCTVDKYMVFYLLDEKEKIASVVRIMYGGRDIQKQLNETLNF